MNAAPSTMLVKVYVLNPQTLPEEHDDIERCLNPARHSIPIWVLRRLYDETARHLWLLILTPNLCCTWSLNAIAADIVEKESGIKPMKAVSVGARYKRVRFASPLSVC